jgi:phosphomevalonate kinase
MNRIKVPGKLFIAGEYQILNSDAVNNFAIVTSVDRYIDFIFQASNEIVINEKRNISEFNDQEQYIYQVIGYVKQIFKTDNNIDLYYRDNLKIKKGKLGLGSSSAIIVAVVKAYLVLLDLKLDKHQIYLISSYINGIFAPLGSGGDIAGNVANGIVYVSKYESSKINQKYDIEEFFDIVKYETKYVNSIIYVSDTMQILFFILNGKIKNTIHYLYTNIPSNTRIITKKYKEIYGNEKIYPQNSGILQKLITENKINNVAFNMIADSYHEFLDTIYDDDYRQLQRAIFIMFDRLEIDYKVSGSGGGDCILLLDINTNQKQKLREFDFFVKRIDYKKLKENEQKEKIYQKIVN